MKKILIKLTLVIIGVLAGTALLEILMAFSFSPEYDFKNMVSQRIFEDNQFGFHEKYFRPSKLLGNELVPNADETVNSLGMRDKEYPVQKPAGTFRILLLGDSVTHLGKWSDYLEERLNETRKIEILNSSVPGWNLLNYNLYLKHKGLALKPDMVMMGICLNDITDWDRIETIHINKEKQKATWYVLKNSKDELLFDVTLKINPVLFRKSFLYRFIVARFFMRREIDEDLNPVIVLKNIRAMAGGQVLAVVFPFIKPLTEYGEKEKEAYDVTRDKLSEAGIDYLDLTELFNAPGADPVIFRARPEDNLHFSDEGNRKITEAVYEWLNDRLPADTDK